MQFIAAQVNISVCEMAESLSGYAHQSEGESSSEISDFL
jgi:hypothetical protein